MKVILRYPKRQELELPGARRVRDILKELNINPESVLVIRGDSLVTGDTLVEENDVIEIRPVMSGGQADALH